MANKKTYVRLFDNKGRLSAPINEYTAKSLRALADEAEAAYEKAKETAENGKVRAGFINLSSIHPEKAKEWGLDPNTQQLHVTTSEEIAARQSRNSGL